MSEKQNYTSYRDAGVNIESGNLLVEALKPLAHSTQRTGANTQLGGFGGLFDLKATGFKDPILVASTDGVGTKLKIAVETGIHTTIGIDLVAMCVNDLIVQGAEPLFFLDYYSTSTLNLKRDAAIMEGISEGCRQAGCALIGGETAEMPGLYAENDYDLAGFSVGAVERDKLLPAKSIKEGDILFGLTSSGVHSNGLSLVRHIMNQKNLQWLDKAPFSPSETLGSAFLKPTRIYVRLILEALAVTKGIKALAHITGGGIKENIPRILPNDYAAEIFLDKIKPLPIFSWLAQTGPIHYDEMLSTFNCGIGMVLLVDHDQAANIKTFFDKQGEKLVFLGTITKRISKLTPLVYSGDLCL